jgi:VWFA-related protein
MRQRFIVLAAVLLAWAGIASAQDLSNQLTIPQISSTSETIRALVSVVDERGAPVRELPRENFKASIDGSPVRALGIHESQQSGRGSSIVLAIDISGSMRGKKIEAAKHGAGRFLATLGDQDYCLLMTFGNEVTWAFQEFTADKQSVAAKLSGLQAKDARTVLNDAFLSAVEKAANARTPQVAVVLLTDGIDDGSKTGLEAALTKAQGAGVPVYTLGYGDKVDQKALGRMARSTGGRFLTAAADADLVELYLSLLRQLAAQYLLEMPLGPVAVGAHTLSVEVRPSGQGWLTRQRQFTVVATSVPSPPPPLIWPWVVGGAVLAGAGAYWLWRHTRVRAPIVPREERPCSVCQKPLQPSDGEWCASCTEDVRVWIEILNGPMRGKIVPISVDHFTIGRDHNRSLVMDDVKSISREHAEIVQKSGRYVLKSSGQGGTFINGIQMQIDEPLKDGDQIGFGSSEPRVVFHDNRARAASTNRP